MKLALSALSVFLMAFGFTTIGHAEEPTQVDSNKLAAAIKSSINNIYLRSDTLREDLDSGKSIYGLIGINGGFKLDKAHGFDTPEAQGLLFPYEIALGEDGHYYVQVSVAALNAKIPINKNKPFHFLIDAKVAQFTKDQFNPMLDREIVDIVDLELGLSAGSEENNLLKLTLGARSGDSKQTHLEGLPLKGQFDGYGSNYEITSGVEFQHTNMRLGQVSVGAQYLKERVQLDDRLAGKNENGDNLELRSTTEGVKYTARWSVPVTKRNNLSVIYTNNKHVKTTLERDSYELGPLDISDAVNNSDHIMTFVLSL